MIIKGKEYNLKEEAILTLSSHKSLLSSKKLKEFISYGSATGILILWAMLNIFFCKHLEFCKITTTDICLLAGTIYAYGGYNTYLSNKDKMNEQKQEPIPNV